MNQYNNFTKTDKAVNSTALILIIFLIIYGYMNDTIFAAFISVVGALIAAFGAVYLTNRKEKITTNKIYLRKSSALKKILNETIRPKINLLPNEISEVKDCISKFDANRSYLSTNLSFVEVDFSTIINHDDLILICERSNISFNKMYDLLVLLKEIKSLDPNYLYMYFVDEYTKIYTLSENQFMQTQAIPNAPSNAASLIFSKRDKQIGFLIRNLILKLDHLNHIVSLTSASIEEISNLLIKSDTKRH